MNNDYYLDCPNPRLLSDCTLLANDGRGYRVELWISDKITDPYRIVAGCRYLTIQHAIEHWDDPERRAAVLAVPPKLRSSSPAWARYRAGRQILAAVRKLAAGLPPQGPMAAWPPNHWVITHRLRPGVWIERTDRLARAHFTVTTERT